MKTIKIRLFVVLWAMLIPLLTANCRDKRNVGKVETVEATEKEESVINVSSPPFKKFVVVTIEEAALYKKADTNSPNLVRWIESDCESDYCENIYQWSDQPGKPGFELSTDIIASEGRVFPVIDEEGNFYKVSILNQWCDMESAYIPKNCVGNIECAPIKADMLEAEDNYFKCRVLKDGKYKDIVLIDEYDELDGETLLVGVLNDGAVATPVAYYIECQMIPEQEETLEIAEVDGLFILSYTKNLAMPTEDDSYQLDLKKLSDEQMAKIIDTVSTKKSEYVSIMYHFPAQGLQSFYYKAK